MADTTETVCANCIKAESDGVELKRCTACKMVRYCSHDCQVAHRLHHKKACEKRAAELLDEELFKDPPEREECPICRFPLPFVEMNSVFYGCCGKVVCCGCVHAKRKEDIKSGKDFESWSCPFCRTPNPKSEKEVIYQLHRGVERNDARSMVKLAGYCISGDTEFQKKDVPKAIELYQKAGELGCAEAHALLGIIYLDPYDRWNRKAKDPKKAKYYWELGVIGGNLNARYFLSTFDWERGNFFRACKHSLINVKAGHEASLKQFENGFKKGYITKDEYAEALRAYQKQHDDAKSALRDEALVYDANPSLYFGKS